MTIEEREAFEDLLFTDSVVLENLHIVETDLFDDAAAGRLSEIQLKAWNAYVRSTPRLRAREDFARKFRLLGFPTKRSWRIFLPLAAALAALIVILIYRSPQPTPIPSPITVAFQLQPGTLRSSGEAQTLRIPLNAGAIRLRFVNPGAAITARLRHVDSGVETWSGPLNAEVPRTALRKGDFTATLLSVSGEELADYTFRVEFSQ